MTLRNIFTKLVQRFKSALDSPRQRVVVGVLVFAILGSLIFLAIHALSSATSVEPENGSVTSPATTGQDNNASGNKYVQYGSGNSNIFGIATGAKGFPSNTGEFSSFDAHMTEMQNLGTKWIRITFPWSKIEHTKGQFNYTLSDHVVAQAKAAHINLIVTFDQVPDWSTNGVTDVGCTGQTNTDFNYSDYASYASALVSRYHNDINVWEIGNEPNHVKSKTWTHPNACQYTKLSQMTYCAIKGKSLASLQYQSCAVSDASAPDRNATILTGGIGGTKASALEPDPDTFLNDLYTQNGGTSKGLFDAVAYHPYAYPNSPLQDAEGLNNSSGVAYGQRCNSNNVPANQPVPGPIRGWCRMLVAHQIMVDHSDHDKKIWMTEFGIGAWPARMSDDPGLTQDSYQNIVERFIPPAHGAVPSPNPNNCYPECSVVKDFPNDTMTDELTEAYHTAATYSWAGPVCYFDLFDDVAPSQSTNGNGNTNAGDFMGLIDWLGHHKPAYDTYKQLASSGT